MKLKDQVAVITGAGRNIGKAMAKLFASEGAKIVVAEMHEGRWQVHSTRPVSDVPHFLTGGTLKKILVILRQKE